MSSAALTIDGLAELRRALLQLPKDLVAEAGPLVRDTATETARQIAAAYPTGPTGNLKQHVSVEVTGDGVSASARVKSTARHAFIYEQGTGARAWKNGKSTGRMPAAHVFIPIAIAHRRAMTAGLVALVTRAGLTVTGTTV